MAPVSTAQRIQRLLSLPREKLRPLLAHPVWRWFWRGLTALSLAAVAAGAYYSYTELSSDGLRVRPDFLLLSLAIYMVTFLMHLMGWHSLSRLLFGEIGLRQDVEAVVGSNLVKYLPTIAWYIANRAHYYGQRGVPQARVVAASFTELGFMVGACAGLLGLMWLYGISPWLAVAVPVAIALTLWALYALRGARFGRAADDWQVGRWAAAFLWYGATWPLAGLFLWAILSAFVPVPLESVQTVLWIWLNAALASYAVSLTLGFFVIAREITLTVLLSQIWPLPVALATAIAVKLVLTLGEVTCSLIVLGALRLTGARSDDE
ncbi:MAG: hypothetical protein HGA45_12840 [Chloroflexales bacterium]|nr:hypothetical protein [Chloroflexales bacterium]